MIQTTVIIPNYNGEKYIKDCLEALNDCEQDRDSFKLLIVDNGSSDSSRAWLIDSENIKKYKYELKLLDTNTGFCGAVNIGIKASATEYVILLNNDTRVRKGFVSALTRALDGAENENIFSASAKMLSMSNPERIDDAGDNYSAFGWAYARGKGKLEKFYNSKKNIFFSCGGACIYKRNIVEKLGFFDENHFAYLEDADLGYRALINGYTNVYEPKAEVLHAGSGTSGSRYNEFKIRLSSRNNMYLLLKNMPSFQVVINMPFLLAGFSIKTLFFIKKGYGKIYINGLKEGIKLYTSKEGQQKKVYFCIKNLPNYLKIQLLLYKNLMRC